jgi:hypothetical protein
MENSAHVLEGSLNRKDVRGEKLSRTLDIYVLQPGCAIDSSLGRALHLRRRDRRGRGRVRGETRSSGGVDREEARRPDDHQESHRKGEREGVEEIEERFVRGEVAVEALGVLDESEHASDLMGEGGEGGEEGGS